ncbi:MAG TPA: glycosyltransferase [Phnomibacter sp.]|nr:glycosyltransferase [Phnomibacter sp.]
MQKVPSISIAICTYNRQKFIGECLVCLSKQDIEPGLWEVIIVDNASTDGTAEIVKNFIAANPALPFRYVYEAQKGLSFARNRSIAEAAAEIVTFIDDDAESVPHFVRTVLQFMQSHPTAAGVGGRVLPKYSESPEPVWMNKYLNGYIGKVDWGGQPRLFEGKMKYPIGCNMTYRKSLMLQAGGFNNQLTFRGDDKHIFFAVTKINAAVYYVHEALVYHNIDANRLGFDYFKKLFLKTGNEERKRVAMESGQWSVVIKGMEYLIKWGVSMAIWLLYTLKGQEPKGRYTMYSQWFTLTGFLKKEVFVR